MRDTKYLQDFELTVDPRPLTQDDISAISEHIKNDKSIRKVETEKRGVLRKYSKQRVNKIAEEI